MYSLFATKVGHELEILFKRHAHLYRIISEKNIDNDTYRNAIDKLFFLLSDFLTHTDNENGTIPKVNGDSPSRNSSSQSRDKSNTPTILPIILPVVTVLGLVSAILVCIWRRSRLKRKRSCKFPTSLYFDHVLLQ
jgi:hypothetical protein